VDEPDNASESRGGWWIWRFRRLWVIRVDNRRVKYVEEGQLGRSPANSTIAIIIAIKDYKLGESNCKYEKCNAYRSNVPNAIAKWWTASKVADSSKKQHAAATWR
jgi:hypothetical protein